MPMCVKAAWWDPGWENSGNAAFPGSEHPRLLTLHFGRVPKLLAEAWWEGISLLERSLLQVGVKLCCNSVYFVSLSPFPTEN